MLKHHHRLLRHYRRESQYCHKQDDFEHRCRLCRKCSKVPGCSDYWSRSLYNQNYLCRIAARSYYSCLLVFESQCHSSYCSWSIRPNHSTKYRYQLVLFLLHWYRYLSESVCTFHSSHCHSILSKMRLDSSYSLEDMLGCYRLRFGSTPNMCYNVCWCHRHKPRYIPPRPSN